MNTSSTRDYAKAARGGLPLAIPALLWALAAAQPGWAQGYGTGAAGRPIAPGSIPSSQTAGMASPGNNDSGDGGLTPGDIRVRGPMDKYLLGPQDVIKVTVERFQDYSTDNIIVPPDGHISLPYFGTLSVIGKTTHQLEAELTGLINHRIRSPRISVSIRQLRPAADGYVHVLGNAVQAQGAVEILNGYRLTEVLAKVGVRGRYEEVDAKLTRGKQLIKLDLAQAILHPQSAANKPLKAEDTLTIMSVDLGRIDVSGDVVRSGTYLLRKIPDPNATELKLKPRLSDLVVAVGGFINNDKLLNGRMVGFVQRGPEKIELRVDDAITFKDPSANIELKPDDHVNFSVELPLSIDIVGMARVPGNYRIRPGSGVLQAIALAGGLTRDTSQTVATLQRNGLSRTIDLAKLLAGSTTENLTLESGDTINLSSPNTLQVSISGAVANPSKDDGLNLPPNATILTAIAQAGGLRLTPDRTSITIIRTMATGEQKFLSIDPIALQERNDPGQNARLQNGDIINVLEKRPRQASILGQVSKTGPFPVDEDGVDLATFIAGAGGPRDTALLSAVKIKSADNTEKTVDAYDAITNGRPLNVKVREDDLVIVPENENRVLVNGAVRNPGPVPLPERRPFTVQDALSAAGGTAPGARLQGIVLVRAQPDGKGGVTPVPRTLDLNNVKKGDIADARLTLQSGDVLVVPEGKPQRDPLSTGLTLFTIFNALRSITR